MQSPEFTREGTCMESKKLEQRYYDLDKRLGIVETKVEGMEKKLDKIDNNTTWILRTIIGSIVGGILLYFFNF